MNAFETLLWHQESGIVTLTLHRPEALNAMTVTMRRELCDALGAVAVLIAVAARLAEPASC